MKDFIKLENVQKPIQGRISDIALLCKYDFNLEREKYSEAIDIFLIADDITNVKTLPKDLKPIVGKHKNSSTFINWIKKD